VIFEQYRERTLHFNGNYALVFRAYDDGVAYRFETSLPGKIKVHSEEVRFNFAADHSLWFPKESGFETSFEKPYLYLALSEIDEESMCYMPALINVQDGPKVGITEVNLEDYPGMMLQGTSGNALQGKHPATVKKEVMENDRKSKVLEREDYIALTEGTRTFPWRVLILSDNDGELIENQMVYKLAKPLQLEDTTWIKPGKIAWDWWNFNNLYGVDFRAGVNTESYKYYIDFAKDNGIEYVILDEGWYVLGDLLKLSDNIDMLEIFRYAEEQEIGLILWVVWKTLEDQLPEALDQIQKWGAKGIKIDFMDRDDQWMVNWYHKIAQETAKRHLLVDFHGAYKPDGIRRAYPNVMTREGVMGLEYNKWSKSITPQHNVTIPFTRMLAGPMDYTPGAMLNGTQDTFAVNFQRPMSMGTRCHQLAMYAVYESPLQMMADSPSNYLRETECLEFIKHVPSVWDETRGLDCQVGEYVSVARRTGKEWYVGAMTNWTPREIEIDFSFLGEGEHAIEIYADGINADRYSGDYKRSVTSVSATDTRTIKMAPGGGWAARVMPQ
jgi:alpha-glucosidase